MGSQVYKQSALTAARAQGLIAEQAKSLTYQQTAALCGVTIDSKTGNSPAAFFYTTIKAYLATTLEREAKEAALEADRLALETQIKKLPAYSDSKVTAVDGEIKVETQNTKPVAEAIAKVT